MQVLVRLGIIVLLSLPGINLAAETSQADFAKIDQQLRQYAQDLRNVAKSMQAHARRTIPAGLSKNEEANLSAKGRDLEATADTAMKLAVQIENRANKARRKVLTRADMDSLGVETDALTVGIKRSLSGASKPKTVKRDTLNVKPKGDQDGEQETIRNERQTDMTAFENFDQKANQLFNILSTVMKSIKEMQMSTTRNLL